MVEIEVLDVRKVGNEKKLCCHQSVVEGVRDAVVQYFCESIVSRRLFSVHGVYGADEKSLKLIFQTEN